MTADPTVHLTDPREPEPSITKGYANPGMIFDALSPSYWVNQLLKDLVGWDPVGEAAAVFSGDWSSFARFGYALENLAKFSQDLGIKIQQGVLEVDRYWNGNAADAAHAYFSELATMVAAQQVSYCELSKQYEDAARGVWVNADVVAGLIRSAIDRAIIAGISSAAGTITAESGVGAVVGYGIAAWQTVEVVNKINEVSKIIMRANNMIIFVFGQLMAWANQGGSLAQYPLPDSAYRHPEA